MKYEKIIKKSQNATPTTNMIRLTNAFCGGVILNRASAANYSKENYKALKENFPAGVSADLQSYNVGESSPSNDRIFKDVNIGKISRGMTLGDLYSLISNKEGALLGFDIGYIQEESSSILRVYDQYIGVNSSSANVNKIPGLSFHLEVDTRSSLLSEAFCKYRQEKKNTLSSNMNADLTEQDEVFLVSKKLSFEINKYVYAVSELLRNLVDLNANSSEKDICNNYVIFQALSKIRSIKSMLTSCFTSARREKPSSESKIKIDSNESKVSIAVKKGPLGANSGSIEKGSSFQKIISPFSKIVIKFPGNTEDVIRSNISQDTQSRSQVFVHPDAKVVISEGKITITNTRASFSDNDIIFYIKKTDLSTYIGEDLYTISPKKYSSQPPADITGPALFKISIPSKAEDGFLEKKSSSTTQSTYYLVSVGGKKIKTTLSEYIGNNGYYSVNGKKVKISLKDAKPIGISDAQKRS
jgi:hypothetical protein